MDALPEGLERDGDGFWGTSMLDIDLSSLEAETRCPVCLGILKSCRLVSGCMHRFCADCIEKWLRVASEPSCPQCRMAMQSRRDCKRDARLDRLLGILYADIGAYEDQVFDPDTDALRAAQQTGAALASAAAAQRAKRTALARPPQAPRDYPGPPMANGTGASAGAGGGGGAMLSAGAGAGDSRGRPKPKKVRPLLSLNERGTPPGSEEAGRWRSTSPAAYAGTPGRGSRGEPSGKRKQGGRELGGGGKRQRAWQQLEDSGAATQWEAQQPEAEAVAQAAELAKVAEAARAAERQPWPSTVVVRVDTPAETGAASGSAGGGRRQRVFLCHAALTLGQLLAALQRDACCAADVSVLADIQSALEHPDAALTLGALSERQLDCRQDLAFSLGKTGDDDACDDDIADGEDP